MFCSEVYASRGAATHTRTMAWIHHWKNSCSYFKIKLSQIHCAIFINEEKTSIRFAFDTSMGCHPGPPGPVYPADALFYFILYPPALVVTLQSIHVNRAMSCDVPGDAYYKIVLFECRVEVEVELRCFVYMRAL